MTGRLAIVVVNYGSHELLRQNLVAAHTVRPAPAVVVVDNFKSVADTGALVDLAAEQGWHVVPLTTNIGFGAGVNRGLAAAHELGCSVVMIINPDAVFTADVVEALRDAALACPDALIAPTIERPDGSIWFDGAWVSTVEARLLPQRSGPGPGRRPWITGCCMTAHADLWNRLGGFDEDYFLYWEDVDLSVRVLEGGGELVVRPDLRIVHDAGGTQDAAGTRAKSAVYYRYNCRNRLLFAAKHLDRRGQLTWIRRTPADAREVVLRGGRRQLIRPHRNLWPALVGCVAGAGWMVRHPQRDYRRP